MVGDIDVNIDGVGDADLKVEFVFVLIFCAETSLAVENEEYWDPLESLRGFVGFKSGTACADFALFAAKKNFSESSTEGDRLPSRSLAWKKLSFLVG